MLRHQGHGWLARGTGGHRVKGTMWWTGKGLFVTKAKRDVIWLSRGSIGKMIFCFSPRNKGTRKIDDNFTSHVGQGRAGAILKLSHAN